MRLEPIKEVSLSIMVAFEGPSYIPTPRTVTKDFPCIKAEVLKVLNGKYIQRVPIKNSRYVTKASTNERACEFCLSEAGRQRWLLLEDM